MTEDFTKLRGIERFFNAVLGSLFRLGIAPAYGHELEVVGRTTGTVHKTPVNLLAYEGRTYLVAPRGETQWVKNARAAGQVVLVRGSVRKTLRVRELPTAERAPLLKAYLGTYESQVARFFSVAATAPEEAFVAIAEKHPVFHLEAV